MTSEAVNLKLVMLEASKLGLRVFRNNVGMLKDINGTPVKYGLGVGSSDLIGWMPCGKFAALEVKATGGKASQPQINFVARVKKVGGFACIIDDEKKLKKLVDEFYKNV